jgi:hypothetical protein
MANQATVQAKLNRRLSKNYGEKKAVLGNRFGVVDVGGGYCNVTLKNGDVIQVLNRRVPMKPFRKVIIGYDQGRKESNSILEVLRFDDVYLNNREPEVPGHSGLHGWLGTDPISVHGQQIVPLLPRSKQTMIVSLFGGNILVDGVFQTIPNMNFDFTSYIPTEGARWVNVEIDENFETHFEVGDAQTNRASLTPALIAIPTSPRKLLFSVKTYVGQTKVIESGASTDIFDPRFAGSPSTGGGGGVWGSITGTLSDQADLQSAIDAAEADAKSYADSLVVGLWDDRGSFDASIGAYPSSGGSGTAGAVMKGDAWTISVAGTLPSGQVVEVGDLVRALIDTPGNTQANWAITQNNIGYVAENAANKATSMTGNETSNILYLTAKAIYDWAIASFSQIGHTHSGGRETLSADRVYYIRTDGSDSNDGLANTSGGAWLTAAKANEVIATLDKNGFDVDVYMGAGTWSEEITPRTGIGEGTVRWHGTLTLVETATSATVAAGSGTTAGTVTKTGRFTGDTHKGLLAYFVTDDEYRVIYSNTNNVLTLADLAPSATTQDVAVYSWGTIVNRITMPVGVGNFEIYGIHVQGDGTYSLYQNAYSAITVYYCQFNDQTFLYSSNNPFINDSYFYETVTGTMIAPSFGATGVFQRCFIRMQNNTGSGLIANRGAQILIYGGTLDGIDGANKATYGFRAWGNATVQFSSGTGIGTAKVYNCDIGVRVDLAGAVIGSAGLGFAGNGSNTSNDGTGLLA